MVFEDTTGIQHEKFSFGLKKSIFNFMNGVGFDLPLQEWFEFKIPSTKIKEDFIVSCLSDDIISKFKPSGKIYWIGSSPLISSFTKTKRGKSKQMLLLTFHRNKEGFEFSFPEKKGEWLVKVLEDISVINGKYNTYSQLKEDFESHFENFELFWNSNQIQLLRENGLLVL